MKRTTLFVPFLLLCTVAFSQHNIIKGRALGIPANSLKVFTLSLGYERMLGANFSVQLLLNRHGYDFRETDGDAGFTNVIVPEMRYYFRRPERAVNRAFFVGAFCERSVTDRAPGGEQDTENLFLGGETRRINPGILLGKNAWLGEKWHFDLYLGCKYKFISEDEDWFVQGIAQKRQRRYGAWGVRVGLNVGYSFGR